MKDYNIGPKGCKRRIRIGGFILICSLVYLIVLLIERYEAFFWIPLLISTFVGLVYMMQAVEKTCIILAANGFQKLDDETSEQIRDNELARRLRVKSTRLLVKCVMITSLLGVFYLLVPK